MNKYTLCRIVVVIILALIIGPTFVSCAAAAEATLRGETITVDSHDRMRLVKVTSDTGYCFGQIVYNEGRPRIYVVIFSHDRGIRNVGYLEILTGDESSMTNAILRHRFNQAFDRECFPAIIPGYRKI